jgi:hypothetical protein
MIALMMVEPDGICELFMNAAFHRLVPPVERRNFLTAR